MVCVLFEHFSHATSDGAFSCHATYVTGGTTAAATFGTGSTGISVTARTDPYNGGQPMAKLVVNVM